MSTPNILTEADILKEIEQTLANQGTQDKPKVKVGGVEVPVDNPQAIQAALDAELNKNRAEFDTLRATVEELKKSRTVEPVVDDKQTVQPVQTTPAQPKANRPPSNEEWTAAFVKDPQRVLDETIGRLIGVDAPGSEALRNIFNGVGTELQKQQAISQALLQKQQELDTRLTESLAIREAQAFIDSTPEYEINERNKQVMQSYLEEYGLPATQKNLKLVYNQAKLDGKIEGQQQQQQVQQQPALRQGVPRIGNTAGSIPEDGQYLLQRANEMPLEDMGDLINRLRAGNFSR